MILIPGWNRMPQAERDAAYNNSAAVEDSPALNAARIEASAAFRAKHNTQLDLAYGESQREQWDIYPGGDASAPVLAFIHGGYWQRNRREEFAALGEGALAMGWSVAMCGYGLGPDVPFATLCRQIQAAFDWLATHGGEHGAGGSIIASGWSAGGHLAALAAENAGVVGALAISGIYELAPIRDTYLNDKLHLTYAEIAEFSPMRRPVVNKPIAIAYGGTELPELRRQSRDFHAMRAESQAPGPLIPVPNADHFRVLDALSKPGGMLLRAAADLLA
ncbi:alpha/beta hydrolase [Plastoroseomonas arctica]|uniref:Alpha/beta hydrolase n=1 Tax=Plastoroseomonas arctica TaxID=1509237 RepID=A0AAF1JYI1_9PROT|nr:alpha/beta hydrolase [Plastoroseomonas arctica]MBR0653555.1 alpha/beta hydrolase [Plastoroseomonas arctica]